MKRHRLHSCSHIGGRRATPKQNHFFDPWPRGEPDPTTPAPSRPRTEARLARKGISKRSPRAVLCPAIRSSVSHPSRPSLFRREKRRRKEGAFRPPWGVGHSRIRVYGRPPVRPSASSPYSSASSHCFHRGRFVVDEGHAPPLPEENGQRTRALGEQSHK